MRFWNCQLQYEDIKITSKAQSNIIELSLWECGYPTYENWIEHPQRFENLMKAISESTIKQSLKDISVEIREMSEDEIINILKKFGMENIRL